MNFANTVQDQADFDDSSTSIGLSNRQCPWVAEEARIAESVHERCSPRSEDHSSVTSPQPSYTEMIATAILNCPSQKQALKEIYSYMENRYPFLMKRGKSWRNSVRHTLSLNECFVKKIRPDNGKVCDWTIHPSYQDSFVKGSFKRTHKLHKSRRKMMDDRRYKVSSQNSIPNGYSDCMYQRCGEFEMPLYNMNYEECYELLKEVETPKYTACVSQINNFPIVLDFLQEISMLSQPLQKPSQMATDYPYPDSQIEWFCNNYAV